MLLLLYFLGLTTRSTISKTTTIDKTSTFDSSVDEKLPSNIIELFSSCKKFFDLVSSHKAFLKYSEIIAD